MMHCKSSPTSISQGDQLSSNDSKPFDQPTFFRSVKGGLQYLTLSRPDIAFTEYWDKESYSNHRKIEVSNASAMQIGQDPSLIGSRQQGTVSTWEEISSLGAQKKQKAVAKSSTEAEYRALSQTATEVAWLFSLFTELGIKHHTPAVIWCDNPGAKQLSSNPVFYSRTKHIEVDVHYIRDLIKRGLIEVRYIPTKEQTTDIFTKAASISQFIYLKDKLAVVSQPAKLEGAC
uniref:Uncharacterized protein n=1 Tax=Cannabis sativa TaxID=3483 RepID=A0A803NGE3_CANSA